MATTPQFDLPRVRPTRTQIQATANVGIADAIEGLAKANNPHVVKVREQLIELECKLAMMIGDRRRAIEARKS